MKLLIHTLTLDIGIIAWVNDYIQQFCVDVITYQYTEAVGGLANLFDWKVS